MKICNIPIEVSYDEFREMSSKSFIRDQSSIYMALPPLLNVLLSYYATVFRRWVSWA